MTGGAGFSISAKKSSKDNRNLARIRPIASKNDGVSRGKNMEKADLNSIKVGIKFRMSRRSSSVKSSYFFVAIVSGIAFLILYLLFY